MTADPVATEETTPGTSDRAPAGQVATEVMAIVLTFDAPTELDRCVRAIDAQDPRPNRILVVDNDGLRPAAETVEPLGLRTPVEVLRMDENTGPAGGHAAGLRRFLETDHDLAWVMDDDCEPQSGALAALVEAARTQPATTDPVYPTWFNTALNRVTNYPAWCGFLIRRSTVEHVGLPRADFFWWMEDTEFLHWRIPEAGYRPQRLPGAMVLHHQDRRQGPKPVWKYYYEVRNATYFRLRVQRGRGRRFYRLARALAGAGRGAAAGPDRVATSLMIARGLIDGLRGDLGARPGLPPRKEGR